MNATFFLGAVKKLAAPIPQYTKLCTLGQGATYILQPQGQTQITGGIDNTAGPGNGFFMCTGGPGWEQGPLAVVSPFFTTGATTYDSGNPASIDYGTANICRLDHVPGTAPLIDGRGYFVGDGSSSLIIFDGNSLMATGTGTDGQYLNVPNWCLFMLRDPGWDFRNVAVGGQGISEMLIRYPYYVKPLLEGGPYAHTIKLVIWEYGNALKNGDTASVTLTSDGTLPASGTVILLDAKPYTLRTTLTPVEGEVLIGGTVANMLRNLGRAVDHTGTPDTDYKCAAEHPTVKSVGAVVGGKTCFLAKVRGATSNTIVSTVTGVGAHLSFGSATLINGIDPTGTDYARIIALMKTYTTQAIADGAEVWNMTFGPRSNYGVDQETSRGIINTDVRNPANIPTYWHGIVDPMTDPLFNDCSVVGVTGAWQSIYSNLDGLHINVLGCKVVAGMVRETVFAGM